LEFTKVIILDTHIWLWWINNEAASLGDNRKELIEAADTVAVSAISCFEVYLSRPPRHGLLQ
jgi:PIN domain nuclease of toxin-antitoxin system